MASTLGFNGRKIEDLRIEYEANVDLQTGATGLRVSIPVPEGRDDLAPALMLTYSSQAGNSAFGIGWSLSGLPSVSIDTRQHVPKWDGTDTYQFSSDELVPWKELIEGQWRLRNYDTETHSIICYRSRTSASVLRVEKWTEKRTGKIHFRTRDARNVLTVYGARPDSTARIEDPEDSTRTFTWLPEIQLDPHGNAVWFQYASETLDGINVTSPFEQRRSALTQRYLKRIRYGNTQPIDLTSELLEGRLPNDLRWCFQVVLDYGDHNNVGRPEANADRIWPVRSDVFSNCRPGFEIRTYRLCRRILCFHDFSELGSTPTLVGALNLVHHEEPAGTIMREINFVGHRNDGLSRSMPPLRLTYSPSTTGIGFESSPVETQENVPAGFSSRRHTFVDLLGEGLPGILTEGERSWFYKPNLGNGHFGVQTPVSERPAIRPGSYSYGDVDRDGDTDVTQMSGRLAGIFEFDRQQSRWEAFRPFARLPHLEALGGRTQWIDLNGDGRSDLIVMKEGHLVWFPSEGESFGNPIEIPNPTGKNPAPLVAEDLMLDFFFLDMNGDGLADLVRIQNGRVEYWPNLGNGRFGEGVLMDNSPWFAADHEFDSSRLRFVDLDGSGTTDIVYIGCGEVACWINASGNEFVAGPYLKGLPYIDNVSTVQVLDFLGNGQSCLVWSSPVPGMQNPIHYLPLASSVPPRLLLAIDDSLGQEIRFTYASSATHYLRDGALGRPWVTKLPTHAVVVDRREVLDRIGGTQSLTRYEYHDGHFDGEEREFRGFGQVDVYDALPIGTLSDESNPPLTPSLTRTWFHLGSPLWSQYQTHDTYNGDSHLPKIKAQSIEGLSALTGDEANDAYRALAGHVLRREIYSVDESGRPGAHPFELFQAGYRIRQVQPSSKEEKAVWSIIPSEQLTATYEQEAGDPRLAHQITLETDAYGQVIREADITYARRPGNPGEVTAQANTRILVYEHLLVNANEQNRFELGIPAEGKDYELLNLPVSRGEILTQERLLTPAIREALATPSRHDENPVTLSARLQSWEQTYYWNDGQSAALPFGQVGGVTLIHHEEAACFSTNFFGDVFGGRVEEARLRELGYQFRNHYYWKKDEIHHFSHRDQFFHPVAIETRTGSRTSFTYDHYFLEIVAVEDAVGNRTTGDIDYHTLSPWRLTDPNGAISEVRYDALGVIVAETVRGAIEGRTWGFSPIAEIPVRVPIGVSDVIANLAQYLQGGRQFHYYDLGAWQRERVPTTTVSLLQEELRSDGRGGGTSEGRVQVQVTYLDGLGRTLQTKLLVEPGTAIRRGADGTVVVDAAGHPVQGPADERWLVSGHVHYNAKQQPVRRYEPFFSTTWRYEGDGVLQHFGVSSLPIYDALGRVITEQFPNGTFSRTTYKAWETIREDSNDTVLETTYYRLTRETLPADDPERQAYEQARAHAGTVTTTFLDASGQTIGSLAQGEAGNDRRTEIRLGGTGEVQEVIDPRGLAAFLYKRDMEGRVLFTHSIDAGDSWMLPDADDRPVYTWDAKGVEVEYTYDQLDRITATQVRGLGLDHRVEERVYGESLADGARRNLRGRLVTIRDQAAETIVDYCDPSGQVLRAAQRLRTEVGEANWLTSVSLNNEPFVSESTYDALGRIHREVLPDGTVRTTDYLRGGGVNHVYLTTPDGQLSNTPIVNGNEYNAHGQRKHVLLGNGAEVSYAYDPRTFRLVSQRAYLGARRFQDIHYTYDPVGNIVCLEDGAHNPGADSLIAGTTISARRNYFYDAHYRLKRATGRVHQALLQHDYIPAIGTFKGTRHLTLNNGAALEEFTQNYFYDAANNIQRIRHTGRSRSWTNDMWISPGSNRSLPLNDPNGLPVTRPEAHFDPTGNLVGLSHLRRLDWSWRNTLNRAVVIERADGINDEEVYTYGADGMRVRKVTTRVVNGGETEITEKVYFGSSERKRLLRGGVVILERWTVHVSDGQGRVALIHRWTTDVQHREVDIDNQVKIAYQLTTHQNSTAIELDQSGNLISYEEYFPYGGTAFIAGDNSREITIKEYRYSGKECDDTTSLYYYGHRYYAPWMGRWLSPDPIGPEDNLNLYQFVLGDPVGNRDPDGLQTTGSTAPARPQIEYIPFGSLPEALQTPEIYRTGRVYLHDENAQGYETRTYAEIFARAAEQHIVVYVYSPQWQRVYEATGDEHLATEMVNRFSGTFGPPQGQVSIRIDDEIGAGQNNPAGSNPGTGGGQQSQASPHTQEPNTDAHDQSQSPGTGAGMGQSRQGPRGTEQQTGSDPPRRNNGGGRTRNASGESSEIASFQPPSSLRPEKSPPGVAPQSGDPIGPAAGSPTGVPTDSPGTELAPPDWQTSGQDPNGSYRGSERGHGEGTLYGTEAGTERNNQNPSRNPTLTNTPGASPQGNSGAGFERLGRHTNNPAPSDLLDYITSLASAASFEFGDQDNGRGAHGVPGGRGGLNGRISQLLFLASFIFAGVLQRTGRRAAEWLARRAVQARNLQQVSRMLERLGRRALRRGLNDPRRAEQIFQDYARRMNEQLRRLRSPYRIEIEPAAFPSSRAGQPGRRARSWFNPREGRYTSGDTTRRLDAGIYNIAETTQTGSNRILVGFDISYNRLKPHPVGPYYQAAFGRIPIIDIRHLNGRASTYVTTGSGDLIRYWPRPR